MPCAVFLLFLAQRKRKTKMFLEHQFSLLDTICAEQKSCFHHSWAVKTEESNLLNYVACLPMTSVIKPHITYSALQCQRHPWITSKGSVAGSWGRQLCQQLCTLYRNRLKIQIFFFFFKEDKACLTVAFQGPWSQEGQRFGPLFILQRYQEWPKAFSFPNSTLLPQPLTAL